MSTASVEQGILTPETAAFYRHAVRTLNNAGARFLVGGAYALAHYTGISRHTKDLDVFVSPADAERVLQVFRERGFHTERAHPHWLAKVHAEDAFLDVIYRSGNGLAEVDQSWMDHAVPGKVVDLPVRLCAAEEMIWSKAFIMERERFDGADVAHLIRARGPGLDWARLLALFGPHWRVLFAHIVLFGYIYPGEADRVPAAVLDELARRLAAETAAGAVSDARICQGTLLSRSQYLTDVTGWGYADARLRPVGRMTAEDVAAWTAAIGEDGSW